MSKEYLKEYKIHEPDENHWILKVGEMVRCDLTGKECLVLAIELDTKHNTVGIWLDSDYLGGGRHPWEVGRVMNFGLEKALNKSEKELTYTMEDYEPSEGFKEWLKYRIVK